MKNTILIIVSLLLGFLVSCNNKQTKNHFSEKMICDTIVSVCDKFDEEKNDFICREKHIFYKDSLLFRAKDTFICKEVHLLFDANKKLEKKSYFGYVSGEKHLFPLIEIWYHQNKQSSLIYYFQKKDSLIIYDKDTIKCRELHIAYDENGNIKEKGCQGYVNNNDISTGMSVGTWFYYKNGKISKEMYYHNEPFGKDYIKYKIYNENGNCKEIYTNNFMLYETDSIALSPQEIKKRVK